MGDKAIIVVILIGMLSAIGFGLVAVFWATLSAITAKVAKPTRDKLQQSSGWAAISWLVLSISAALLIQTPIVGLCVLIAVPCAVLASVGGACYDESDDE